MPATGNDCGDAQGDSVVKDPLRSPHVLNPSAAIALPFHGYCDATTPATWRNFPMRDHLSFRESPH